MIEKKLCGYRLKIQKNLKEVLAKYEIEVIFHKTELGFAGKMYEPFSDFQSNFLQNIRLNNRYTIVYTK
ncbi:14148_t:CDS:2 [Funneliformis mosseae]|uniref:14148_t:CDS:1 n=1 Tax=Funneliformis mosseae TaxID=27381 RepID=A0A9N9CIY3_FUNMO|nr:14148_t:CDS:2 [Funneliformis mosseae]